MRPLDRKRLLGAALLLSGLVLQGCYSQYSTVPRSVAGQAQSLEEGTVVATRNIVIDGEASFIGQSSGALIGSAVGQTAGRGSGRTIAAAGGAVVGGIVGGMVEKEVTKKFAQELTVALDDGGTVVVVQARKGPGFIDGDRVTVTQTRSGQTTVSHSYYVTDGL